MRLSSKKLLLVANPFAAPLGEDGRAMALCPIDPTESAGGQYVGARTKAATVERSKADEARMRSPFGPRDKVKAEYDLKPRSYPDTTHFRAKVKSGEAFEAGEDQARAALRSAARAVLGAFVAGGGDRAAALATWRAQGLGAVVDMLTTRTSAKLPPASDELREAGPRAVVPTPATGTPAILTTEGG